tara:strand:- start:800 stop:1237 length:438 start_codon:yes stop_codon:yes gene_type:complete
MVVTSVGKSPKETKIMNESNKNNKTQETAPREVPRDLPELDEVDVISALSHENLSWAHGFMNAYRVGQTQWLGSIGVHIQKVTEDTVRCVAVVDHGFSFAGLMMLKMSFEAANIELELAPYTLVIPYIPVDDVESSESTPGLEVA